MARIETRLGTAAFEVALSVHLHGIRSKVSTTDACYSVKPCSWTGLQVYSEALCRFRSMLRCPDAF